MSKTLTFFIMPTNEGQELNYTETYEGVFVSAKVRAKEIVDSLKPVMFQGSIGCKIEDHRGVEVAYYDGKQWARRR